MRTALFLFAPIFFLDFLMNPFPFFLQLSGQRVYNLSRTPKSQVQQTLRVSYADAHKIHKFLETIKVEVQKLPKLITDGSR
jgi:hypothetical protein